MATKDLFLGKKRFTEFTKFDEKTPINIFAEQPKQVKKLSPQISPAKDISSQKVNKLDALFSYNQPKT